MKIRIVPLVLLLSFRSLAAPPFATVTAGRDLKINGKLVQSTGAPNWPVAFGDELVTDEAPAVVSFVDGARLTLAPATKVVLQHCDRQIVQLFRGSTDYVKPAASRLEFCALGHRVRPKAETEGSVLIEARDRVVVKVAGQEQVASGGKCACDAGAPWGVVGMSSATKALIITGAGAGGTAIIIGVTRPSDKSPK